MAVEVRVVAPDATSVQLVIIESGEERSLARAADEWVGTLPEGTVYGLVADGEGPTVRPEQGAARPPGAGGRLRSNPRSPSGSAAGRGAHGPAGRRPTAGAATAGPSFEPPARRLRGPRPRADPWCGWVRAGHLRRAHRPVAPPRRARRHRARAAARPPAGSAGGQLLGLHAAGVRRRRASSGRGRRRRSRAGRPGGRGTRRGHRGLAGRRVQPHDRGRCGRSDVQPPRAGRCSQLPAASGRLVRGDDRVRQRSRRRVTGRPRPRAVVARSAGRPRHRRLPVRPGVGAGPQRQARRPHRGVGTSAGRGADRRAVGRRRHVPARAGVAGRRLAAVERSVPRRRPRVPPRRVGHGAGPAPTRRRAAPTCSTVRRRASTS